MASAISAVTTEAVATIATEAIATTTSEADWAGSDGSTTDWTWGAIAVAVGVSSGCGPGSGNGCWCWVMDVLDGSGSVVVDVLGGGWLGGSNSQ